MSREEEKEEKEEEEETIKRKEWRIFLDLFT